MYESLTLLLTHGWELYLTINANSVLVTLSCNSTTLEESIFENDISLIKILEIANELIERNIPSYYISLLSEYHTLKNEKEDTLYRIQRKDISLLVSDKAYTEEISKLFKSSFSCMEDVQYFVVLAENQLNLLKEKDRS